jgi:hypothetical protein
VDPEGGLEKLDDAKARARVKAQIEADKKERAEKAAREKALREGVTLPQEVATTSTSTAAPPKPAVAGKDFPETRLQIRMASGGQPYVTTLSSDASECTLKLSVMLARSSTHLIRSQLFEKLRNIWPDKRFP